VIFLFGFLDKEDIGRSIVLGLGAMLFAIKIRWDLRRRIWFWVVITLLLALHVPLFLFSQWPHGWVPGVAMLPFVFADCMIIVGVVRFVEKFIMKASPEVTT
jgi:peptidoglycan/LPS O-acetylase OafA/YrhL